MSHKYGTYFVWRDYFLGHSLELKVKKRPFSTPQKSKMSYFLTSTRQHVNTSTRQHLRKKETSRTLLWSLYCFFLQALFPDEFFIVAFLPHLLSDCTRFEMHQMWFVI